MILRESLALLLLCNELIINFKAKSFTLVKQLYDTMNIQQIFIPNKRNYCNLITIFMEKMNFLTTFTV